MGVLDDMKKQGFKPKASSDGLFEPLVGVYKASWDTCRKEVDEKNGNVAFIQAEWNIQDVLGGDPKRPSKYADFRKRYYIEGDGAEKGMQNFLDDAFTAGVDLSNESDETLQNRFQELIGKVVYLRAWGYEGRQYTVLQQEKAALKAAAKVKQSSVGF